MVDQVVHRGLGVNHVGHGGETLLVPHGGDHTDAGHACHLHHFLILHSDDFLDFFHLDFHHLETETLVHKLPNSP